MKKILKWLDDNIELYICVFLMSFMTLLVFVQVVMRYVFNNSLSWSEELARYTFMADLYWHQLRLQAEKAHQDRCGALPFP